MISKTLFNRPCVGIIMLDTRFPRIKGDIGNPATFDFPVLFQVVKDASPKRVVLAADKSLIQPFIAAGQALIDKGAKILTTSCGFLALFQKELTRALSVPIYSSSLLQVHLAQSIIGQDKKVGIITARKAALTRKHLAAIHIDQYDLKIIGMEAYEEFSSVFIGGKQRLDTQKCGQEMQAAAASLIKSHPDIGAIVLECTNMPPYGPLVHKAANGRPVFDIVTMMNYAYSTLPSARN